MELRRLLIEAPSIVVNGVTIAPVPGSMAVDFGVTAAKAMEDRRSTASGRTASALRSQFGAASARWCSTCVGATTETVFQLHHGVAATTDALIARSPEKVTSAVRALTKARRR